MDLINFVNKEYRVKTVAEILTKGNTDGEDGLSWQEVHELIKNGHNKESFLFNTVKFFWGTKKMTESVFKALDEDESKTITLEECDNYVQKECNCSLKELWNMTVADVCELIDSKKKYKKKSL